ncbi:hypothetical protein F5Y12DRAFT_711655 [Xylaria sp. FL1777]|nr:hypothetical protein F5Y12DRAFT_711655 [Xylaria sp. FL1777]
MAPVWADREGASCGLNTIKHASGCSDETLCLFCSILLASSQACSLHALSCHTLKTHSTKQYRALLSAPRLSGVWGNLVVTKGKSTKDGRFSQLWLAMLAKCRKLGRIQNHLHQERRGIHAGAAGAEAPLTNSVPFTKKWT